MHDAGAAYRVEAIVGSSQSRELTSSCPTLGIWFGRFQQGCRSRMGMVKIQNEPMSSAIIHAMDEIATEEWTGTDNETR